MNLRKFPRYLIEYLFKNIDKGLIDFCNIESEIHFYETYDTTNYWDILDDSDELKEG